MSARPDLIALAASARPEALSAADNLHPFGAEQRTFAAALSHSLTTQAAPRRFPELVALGFWLRPANLERMRQTFESWRAGRVVLPRGLAFHVAPSNVDTIFVYSWLVSLLAGNRNIVRLSTRESDQTNLLLTFIGDIFSTPEAVPIAARTSIVRYDRDEAINRYLSSLCDLRVVWGGDATVQHFRAYPLAAHATEISFPSKTSACVLHAPSIQGLSPDRFDALVHGFCNDAFWYDQMACSSPRFLIWLGEPDTVETAANRLWPSVARELERRGGRPSIADCVNKRATIDMLAIEFANSLIVLDDPRVSRVRLGSPALREDLHCGGGLFHEFRIDCLADLLPLLSRKVQTLTYFGVDAREWRDVLVDGKAAGIDRAVPVGQALDFDATWDGVDLFAAFTRQIVVR